MTFGVYFYAEDSAPPAAPPVPRCGAPKRRPRRTKEGSEMTRTLPRRAAGILLGAGVRCAWRAATRRAAQDICQTGASLVNPARRSPRAGGGQGGTGGTGGIGGTGITARAGGEGARAASAAPGVTARAGTRPAASVAPASSA